MEPTPQSPAPLPPPASTLPPMPASAVLPPATEPAPAPHELPKKNASYGALISIIIILAIVVVGAFYSWGKRIEQNTPAVPTQTTTP